MQCISLASGDPCFNLAVDEFLLKNSTGEYLILGVNDRSVIIGKHQLPHRETDTGFVTKSAIPVIRRISGGGTVFHDPGNLNFSLILNSTEGKQVDFRKYIQPVISFLSSLGVDARFEGKNDLKVGGLKISGNAEHIFRNRVLHHGTLLFSADLGLMRKCFRNDNSGYETRAVNSNPSAVTNLDGMLRNVRNTLHFRDLMLGWFLDNYPGTYLETLSVPATDMIRKLAKTRYMTWEWNYGYGPPYSLRKRFKYRNENASFELSVRDGIIQECIMKGHGELEAAGMKLEGCRHMPDDVGKILEKENIFSREFDVYIFF